MYTLPTMASGPKKRENAFIPREEYDAPITNHALQDGRAERSRLMVQNKKNSAGRIQACSFPLFPKCRITRHRTTLIRTSFRPSELGLGLSPGLLHHASVELLAWLRHALTEVPSLQSGPCSSGQRLLPSPCQRRQEPFRDP
jgi:hypothetical protein